jgi:diacylglycerol kinase (ATP)
MNEQEKWLIVVNPKAGKKKNIDVPNLVGSHMKGLPYEILEWTRENDFSAITRAIHSENFTYVVAAGGDGTVNRVGRELLEKKAGLGGRQAALGILPLGSGNGLARSLGINMEPAQALKQLLQKKISRIDAGNINGHAFFCTAGVGFDAHIGGLFASSETRGLRSYVQIVLRELVRYRAKQYTVEVDGKSKSLSAFLITLANAGQYGNDFYIAPQASLQDGILQVVILKPFNLLKAPGIVRRMLGRQAHLSPSIETLAGKNIVIERDSNDMIHFDGEPFMENKRLVISVHAGALKVLTGPGFG